MESYVVRIYRRDKDAAYSLVGIVEDIGAGNTRVFHTPEELISIIRGERKELKNKEPLRGKVERR